MEDYMFELPKLKYAYDALEPYIDTKTMEIHHTKHHQTYTNNLNEAIGKHPELSKKTIEELLKDIETLPKDVLTTIKNNAGGYHNHNLFWEVIAPKSSLKPTGKLADDITKTFGTFDEFKQLFSKTALTRFGSGWSWLVIDQKGKLIVESTANQDSPISKGNYPLLLIDVWEHAYYLKYQNRRSEYIENWWNVVNWDAVEQKYVEHA
jgi:superoxide dismutase, Fe-Mn family